MGLYFNRRKAFREVAPTYAASTAELDGTSHKFDAGNLFNPTTLDYSITCTFKTSSSASQYMVSKYGTSDPRFSLIINAGNLRLTHSYNAASQILVKQTTATFDDGAWHNVIVFVDRSASDATFYVDGSLEASTKTTDIGTITNSMNNSDDFEISDRSAGSDKYFAGELLFTGIALAADLTANATELYGSGTPPCWAAMSSGLKSKFSSNGGEFWELAEWSGHTGQALTGQANSNTIGNASSTPFTGSGIDVECT